MCTQYNENNENINDIFIMPIEIYNTKLCLSYDNTNLFITTITRLCLYVYIYYFLTQYLKINFDANLNSNTFKYIDYFLLAIIFINVISLVLIFVNTPTYKK